MVAADVKCLHCGYVSGEVVAESPDAKRMLLFRPAKGYAGPLPGSGNRFRCGRCGGPVFLDDLRTVRMRSEEPIGKPRRKRRWAKKPLALAG